MNAYFQNVKTYLKKPWVIGCIVVLVLIIVFAVRSGSTNAQNEIVVVKSGTVSEEVSVTGKVKAAQAVDLSLERSGKVVKINKEVGDEVTAGETIVQIDNAETAAQLAQAQASLSFQQSKLSELVAGTRPEQIQITSTKVQSAKTDVANANTALIAALENAYTSADDAIRNKIDVFYRYPRSSNPQVLFTSTITGTSLETGRVEVETRLQEMKKALDGVSSTSNLTAVTNEFKKDLGEIKLFLDNVSLVVNALTKENSDYLSETTLATYKSNVSLARTTMNTAISSVLTSENTYNAANTSYTLASQQLNLESSGAVSQEIEAQRAQVAQAQANVNAVYAQLAKTYIKAPITGVVTKQDVRLGETAQAGVNVVSVMADAQFEIEAFVPEADIAKIKVGQEAEVTLDAYGQETVFDARVVTVAPAETIIEGVATYKTTFQFEGKDDRIKSGMTANIDIKGETHPNALSIPQRAITTRNGVRYVSVKITEDTTKEVEVKTGLRGSDGAIEIVEGLHEGDQVVIKK